jgi:hypothetical protein
MFVYIEVHYSTTDKSQKNFVLNYPVMISDGIQKSFSKEKKLVKGNYGTVFLVNSFNDT